MQRLAGAVVALLLVASDASAQLFLSQDANPIGLYRLDTETGKATRVGAGTTTVTNRSVGLTESADPSILYGSRPISFLIIQADGSGVTQTTTTPSEGLAFCAHNGIVYATINGDFFTIDIETGSLDTVLSSPGLDLEGLACDAATGRVFGIGNTTLLRAYTIASDTWVTVGNTGINWNQGGLAFDPGARVLYAVGEGGGPNLYRINPVTAQPTLVGSTGLSAAEGGLAFVVAPISLALTATPSPITPGESLQVGLTLANPGSAAAADVFVGMLTPPAFGTAAGCPGGDAIVFFTDGFAGMTVRCLSASPATFPALVQGITIPGGVPTISIDVLFSMIWPGWPPGVYRAFLLLARPDAFVDGTLDPGDVLAIGATSFTAAP